MTSTSEASFVGDLAANLLGAFVGVFLALLVDRVRENRRRTENESKLQSERDEQEADQLRIVQWLAEENLELSGQALTILNDYLAVVSFRMNTHLLDSAVLQLSTLSQDQELLWQAEHFRYQLHHVNEKLDAWVHAVYSQGAPDTSSRGRINAQFVPTIQEQLARMIIPMAKALLPVIRARIQRLSRKQLPPVRPAMP